jgi:septal ring factor EnvC (AmiA/AmiB activator)
MADFATREELAQQIQQLGYEIYLKDQQISELATRVTQLEYNIQQTTAQLNGALDDQSKFWNLIDWIDANGSDTIKQFVETL